MGFRNGCWALVGAAAGMGLALGANAQVCPNVKLNQAVPEGSDIVGYGPIPDGSDRVTFLGDLETEGFFDLFTVPASGERAPIRFDLITPRAQGLADVPVFSPDGATSVFRGDFDTEGVRELYSISTADGGGVPTKLNGELIGDVQREIVVTPDGENVVYLAEEDTGREELYIVPLFGGTSRRLNDDLQASDVEEDFELSPDGEFVVYRAPQDTTRDELYSVRLAGGDPVRLNATLQSLGVVTDFRISPDGRTVVYRADQIVDNRFDLYQVPIGGGEAMRITGDEVERSVEDEFRISPDSTHVVYANPRFVDGAFGTDLYSVSVAGGDPVRLNAPLPAGGFVADFAIDPTSELVVLEGSVETNQLAEVFSVPIGGGTMTKLSGDLSTADGTLGFGITPDGTRVVFGIDRDPSTGTSVRELAITPIDGGPITTLVGPLTVNGDVGEILFTPDGSGIVYSAEADAVDRLELFQVPLDGRQPPRRINRELPDGASVGAFLNPDFQFSDDGRYVLFLADQETVGVTELWSAELFCEAVETVFSNGFEAD